MDLSETRTWETAGSLTCPACGGRAFTAEQLTWNTQPYDADTDDWGLSTFVYEEEYILAVRCASCAADCTPQALAHGWRIHHEHLPERRLDTVAPTAVPVRMKVTGQQGELHDAALTSDGMGLHVWRGDVGDRYPLCTIRGTLPEQIAVIETILAVLLDRHAAQRAAETGRG